MRQLPIVIVVAPSGAGKSRHAQALMKRFGCTHIVDEWDGRERLQAGALALTNAPIDSLAEKKSPAPTDGVPVQPIGEAA